MKAHEIIRKLESAGIDWRDAVELRRISMTLCNWWEKECGVDSGHIERDEETGIPYWHGTGFHINGKWVQPKRHKIRDMEKGALARLNKLRSKYPALVFYEQTDPRGASIYVLRRSEITDGEEVARVYSRGVAVWKGY